MSLNDAFPYFFNLQEDNSTDFDEAFECVETKYDLEMMKSLLKKHDIITIASKNSFALRSMIKMSTCYEILIFELHVSNFSDAKCNEAYESGHEFDNKSVMKLIKHAHMAQNDEIKQKLKQSYVTKVLSFFN